MNKDKDGREGIQHMNTQTIQFESLDHYILKEKYIVDEIKILPSQCIYGYPEEEIKDLKHELKHVRSIIKQLRSC